ncbi:MAG: polyprenyl synthetase family protein [Anaerolineaceae bacterium]|jgi:geranylgeranyl diphosphate synthase type I
MPNLLDEFSAEMLPAVEQEMLAALDDGFPAQFVFMHSMLAYHLGWQEMPDSHPAKGKRIRPLILLLSAIAVGGDWRPALPAAAAVEFLHNFSLIHDDIEDRGEFRHGRPALWKKEGVAQAINAGDALFSVAFLTLQRLAAPVSAEAVRAVYRVLGTACLNLTGGQSLDLDFEVARDIDVQDYWTMIEGKTAALMSAAAEIGALLGDGDAEKRAALAHFGHYLGLAFQTQDDQLGIWGETATTGKSAESDLVTGKKSLPVIYALQHDAEFKKRWNSGPIFVEEVSKIVADLDRIGAKDYTQQQTDTFTQKALDYILYLPQENKAVGALKSLAENLTRRRA